MSPAQLTEITIAEGHVLYVDDRSYGPGETVKVPASEAKQLVDDGTAERGKRGARDR